MLECGRRCSPQLSVAMAMLVDASSTPRHGRPLHQRRPQPSPRFGGVGAVPFRRFCSRSEVCRYANAERCGVEQEARG